MPAPRRTDWSEIERLYRDGVLSVRAIADQTGVTEGAIRKEAKKACWVRSESTKVRALAKKLAADRTVPVYAEPGEGRTEALAKVGADILEAHQRRFARLQRIVDKQINELEEAGDQQFDLEERLEDFFLHKAAGDPERAGIFKMQLARAQQAIRLPSRAKVLVDLVNSASKLSDMERRAFNLDEGGDGRSYEDLLAEIHAKKEAA